jgi:hypothetical protein
LEAAEEEAVEEAAEEEAVEEAAEEEAAEEEAEEEEAEEEEAEEEAAEAVEEEAAEAEEVVLRNNLNTVLYSRSIAVPQGIYNYHLARHNTGQLDNIHYFHLLNSFQVNRSCI